MDYYKCEQCGKSFDEFEMDYAATQMDKKTLCDLCRKANESGIKRIENAVYMIQGVFDDMDKDFTIWEYRKEIEELLRAGYFVNHIQEHFKEEHPGWKVKCKICDKTIDEIYKEEKK